MGRGWWRHGNGGYGWIGPLFWPFAYYDIYDYALWGSGYDDSFWDYGYDDIYAGVFAPYGYDALTGYLPQYASGSGQTSSASGTPNAATDQLAQMCGEDTHDIAGLPIGQIQQVIQPTDAQRAALDQLAQASAKAAQDIKSACPTDISLTAPGRLAFMQQRIKAMIAAADAVRSPLDNFYGLLNDEQKARFNALGKDQRNNGQTATKAANATTLACDAGQSTVTEWPTAEIDKAVHPTDAQRESLNALQNATTKAAAMLKASFPTDNPLTAPARLAAVSERLDAMLQAVTTVRSALNDFYGELSDEQKARFEALGPQRTSQSDQQQVTTRHTNVHRRGVVGIGYILRHLGI